MASIPQKDEVKIILKFDYENFYSLVQYAISDSITIDDKKISKDLPIVDRLETELLEKEYEISYLKQQIELLEGSNANNG